MSARKKRIRVGLIGAGAVARRVRFPRMLKDGAVDLVAVAEPDAAQVAETMKAWGRAVPAYDDYRKMIRAEKLDAVFIASPHSLHHPQAKFALQHGLHVLVEKPLTIEPRHAKELFELARKHDRALHICYQRHTQAPFVYGRELIQKGVLGEICGVSAYTTQWWMPGGWRGVRELSGGGFLMDSGSHLIAVVLWLTGLHPEKVSAFVSDEKPVDRQAVVQVKFRGGVLGSLAFFGRARGHDERISIHGDKGCLVYHVYEWQNRTILLNDEPLKIPARIKDSTPDAEFFRAIRSGNHDNASQHSALEVARLKVAAYRAAGF